MGCCSSCSALLGVFPPPSSLPISSSLPFLFFSYHVLSFRPLLAVKMMSPRSRRREPTSPEASSRPGLLSPLPEETEATTSGAMLEGPSRAEPSREPLRPRRSEASIAEIPSRPEFAAVLPQLEPKQAALLWRCGIAFEDACCT